MHERQCVVCGGLFTSWEGDSQTTHGNCSEVPDWQPYSSVLAGCYGVKNESASASMSTFRPCDTWAEAVALAAEMNAANYVGDGLDYAPAMASERGRG